MLNDKKINKRLLKSVLILSIRMQKFYYMLEDNCINMIKKVDLNKKIDKCSSILTKIMVLYF